jgi:hypothetical protein
VSADEIMTAPPRVKYKDILISRKSGSNDEQSGHSSHIGHTHIHTHTHTHDDSNSRSFHRNDNAFFIKIKKNVKKRWIKKVSKTLKNIGTKTSIIKNVLSLCK